MGFQCVLSSVFLLHASYHSHLFPPWIFAPCPLVSCIFKHFQCMFPRILPVSFISDGFCTIFLLLLSHFPALSLYFSSIFTASSWFVPSIRSSFLHFARFPLIVTMSSCSFIVFSNASSSWVFSVFCPAFFCYMLPTILPSFLHGCLHHVLWFLAFSNIFNVCFQEFYPSPSFSDGFCTIFLLLLSHFPALSLYFSSIFTASSWFVPSIRSSFLHFARFPLIVIMSSCSFIVFSNASSSWVFSVFCPAFFLLHASYHSHLFPPWMFAPCPLVSCIFKHFQCMFPRILPVSFIFRWFLHQFSLVFVTFSCTFTVFFQHFYGIVMVCS